MKETLEEFLKFEQENNLFDLKIENIYIWPITRRRVSDNILLDKGIVDQADHTTGESILDKFSFFIKYNINSFKNLFNKYPIVDEVIINHPRKIKVDNEYIDIYTYYICKELEANKTPYFVLDVPYNWHKHLINKNAKIYNMENFSLIKKIIYPKIYKKRYKNNPQLKEISEKLKIKFGSDGNFINIVIQEIQKFKIDYKYYTNFFKKVQPKRVSMVISEVYPGIVQAAKNLNIETVEIQHGAITKEHMAYEYPKRKNVPYFPDKIRLFGEYWYDIVDFPLKKSDIILTENSFLYEKALTDVKKINNQLLFVTQGWITSKMILIIKDLLEKTDEYKVVVKLHPSEFEYWQKTYPELILLKEKYNLEVVDNFEKSIYDYLNESKYVVGVSSTCLYEALVFNCEVHLLDLPSVEIMQGLVEKKLASKSKNADELLKNLKKKSNGIISKDYIYYRKEVENENRK